MHNTRSALSMYNKQLARLMRAVEAVWSLAPDADADADSRAASSMDDLNDEHEMKDYAEQADESSSNLVRFEETPTTAPSTTATAATSFFAAASSRSSSTS